MAKGLARQRFQERQQRNRIVSQLNQLKAAGYTTEDIRAAGSNAYRALTQAGQRAPTGTAVSAGTPVSTPAVIPGTAPGGPARAAAGGPPQWWQYAQQYGQKPQQPAKPITTGTPEAQQRAGYKAPPATEGTGPAYPYNPNQYAFGGGAYNPYEDRPRPDVPAWLREHYDPTWLQYKPESYAFAGGTYNPFRGPKPNVPAWLQQNYKPESYAFTGGVYDPYGGGPKPDVPAWLQQNYNPEGYAFNRGTYNPFRNAPKWKPTAAGASAAAALTPPGPQQWWQFAKQYSLPKQPPEAPLDDFYYRHLNTTTLPWATTTSGGGYGYGSGYKKRRKGGGGGRYSYAPRQSYAPSYKESAAPGWALGGLANWTFG